MRFPAESAPWSSGGSPERTEDLITWVANRWRGATARQPRKPNPTRDAAAYKRAFGSALYKVLTVYGFLYIYGGICWFFIMIGLLALLMLGKAVGIDELRFFQFPLALVTLSGLVMILNWGWRPSLWTWRWCGHQMAQLRARQHGWTADSSPESPVDVLWDRDLDHEF